MAAHAPLGRPTQSQVKLDLTPNRPQSDGFTWPTFRLLNKKSRVILSSEPLVPSNFRKAFATASANGGWFAASTSSGLIISPLSELRAAFKTESASNVAFTPQRTLSCNPVALAFACNDTRLLAGTAQGDILVFDTAQLFSAAAQVDPLQIFQDSPSPASQILPNPSTENELAQLVVIVRVNGTVQMFDMNFESRGAWAGTDSESTLVAASWSPKGKQLAIGLRTGDILTFGLTNNAQPLKHIPGTANAPLVSLNWVGPAHTFRTSYGSGGGDPPHHIVSLDARSNTAAFVQLIHPYPMPDRVQNAQVLILPRWDQDAAPAPNEEAKTLFVVGDMSSTDLEVLGNAGPRWCQQSQENQLTVPLDKNDEDTFLLALDVDLTDELPIMYAYLNDGTVQAWYITHPDAKPYAGLIGAAQTAPSTSAFGQQAGTSSAFGQQQPAPATSAFAQSAFSQPQTTATTSAFGQASAFGQPQTSAFSTPSTSAFGQPSAFGQQPAFGQSSFGAQPSSSAFGQSSFGAQPSSTPSPSPFGAPSSTSAFGAPAAPSAFSSTGGGFAAFASSSSSAFGTGAANAPPAAPPLMSTPSVSMGESTSTPSAFGGLSLGGSNSSGSDADNKFKAVGGGMFGSPSPLPLPPNHPANQPAAPVTSAFSDASLIKPASGFGAFGAVGSGAFGGGGSKPSVFSGGGASAFGGGAFSGGGSGSGSGDAKPASAAPAFGKPAFGQSAFGQSGFGQPGFGQKPASAFGQPGFGAAAAAATTPSSGGGFSAFASSAPKGFTNAATGSAFGGGSASASASPPASGGGFGAFSSSAPSAFGAAVASAFGGNSGDSSKSAFGGGSPSPAPASATPSTAASAFAGFGTPAGSPSSGSAFGGGGSATPSTPASAFAGFGTPSGSLFGNKTPQTPAVPQVSASSSPDSARDGKSPSPTDSPPAPLSFTASSTPPTGGAFGNLRSASSGFKPASGFGAFGSDTTPSSSPFFNAASSQAKTPPVSAFGAGSPSTPVTPTPAAGKPAFGAPSVLGGPKSAFAPISAASTPAKTAAPVSGGFSAFGGSPAGLTSSATPAKSFGELLKAGDETPEKAKAKAASVFGGSGSSSPQPQQGSSEKLKLASVFGGSGPSSPQPQPGSSSATPIKPVPVFSAPPKDDESETKESAPKGEKEAVSPESSFAGSSQSSSFVEVSGGEAEDAEDAEGEAEDGDAEEGDEDNDGDSFLSESFGSDSEEAPPDDDDGEDDDAYSRSPSPSEVPLPPSRSPSSTPHAEVPKILVSPSPTPSEESDSSEDSRLSTIREESTTPPGSPEKKERASPPQPKTPLTAPVPIVPSPFGTGIGLGRPSTRPTRSSPLANAPVSGDEDDKEKEKAKEKATAAVQEEKKAHLASPKPIFGVLPTQVKTEPVEEHKGAFGTKPARPKTPPLSALSFGSPTPKAPSNIGKIPLGGAPLPALSMPSPVIASKSSPTSAPTSPGGFFGFGTPKSATPPTPSTPSTAPKGFFGVQPAASATPPTPSTAPKGFFGIQPAASSSKPQSPAPVAPELTMEEGMQKECAILFANMTRELEDFRLLAQAASQKRLELSKSAGGSRRAADLGNRTKWALGDVVQFGQAMRMYEQDLAELKEGRAQQQKQFRELQSNLLKAGTRREEIGRFLKAQHDNDFAKMLKARTLGPEHLETQTHLRRSIRAMQDRIQKLESHLQDSKKRLSRANTGNPGLRAPTLDTLNRTFRNMDIALDNQTSDIERLTARVAKLNMNNGQRRTGTARDARLPNPVTRQRPFNVTPHVAVTTAAALNAERSAHKLKRALLSVRKEPLLNTQAASAPPAPLAFQTPQRAGLGIGLGVGGPATPMRGLSLGLPGPSTPPQAYMPGFDFPEEDNFNPSPPPATRRGAGGSGKTRISNSVPLRRSPGQPMATPSPPPSFDWGPLPNFQKKPAVAADLGGSWVSDGFGSKK
ncbi:hypothetical protein B0H17DRAFT_1206784 [Mycena rosella]|uniref:Nucleoporin Nup159/Nup146 N-terminal domain-containing protein n=1 Tax=Mycena rosella TaxID=1033263 RepID=A0AAD7D5U2_MYCRO|nr:hypothetical protein B0H17DRAFT_1206784 [Mycena rosella]